MKKALCPFLAVLFLLSACLFLSCEGEKKNRTSYDISCEYFEDGTLSGSETVDYYNDTDLSVNELKFNLYGNAFRKDAVFSPVADGFVSRAYYSGESYGGIEIIACKVNGVDAEFSVCGADMNVLSVLLLQELFPQERAQIFIEYKLTLAKVVARTGINRKTINLANFYPVLCARDEKGFYECVYYPTGDPFFSDCADYKVTLTTDKKFVACLSGKRIQSKEEGDKRTVVYGIENARSFCAVLSENFESVSKSQNGVEINYFFYDDSDHEKTLSVACEAVKFFSDKFGAYPYPTFNVVQTEFIQGGMEYPSLVMISDGLEKEAYSEVVVHETAHQWWQSVVGTNENEYAFIDEGLAEYSVVLFYENFPEYGMNRSDMIASAEKTYGAFCTVFDKLFGGADTRMSRNLGDFSGEYEYVNIAYIKSCLMFETLRQTIGDAKFFNGLKSFYSNNSFRNVTPSELIGAFEKVGANSNGFFESFIDGKVVL